MIPDFAGSWPALQIVIDANPDVLNHNIESTPRVFSQVRPKGDYQLSLDLLARVKQMSPQMVTKSGIIVGMGESKDELVEVNRDDLSDGGAFIFAACINKIRKEVPGCKYLPES